MFEGEEPPRPPLHFESDDKETGARLSDIIGAGAKIASWRKYYVLGGPLRRIEGEKLRFWASRVEGDRVDWPDYDEIIEAIESYTKRIKGLVKDKFTLFKILGPTETAESFFAKPLRERREMK
ncbi:MAG: hypothetical protein DRJ47_10910 [Thermoprotei archaeon]|nr:MAG: hypothetical protein DRJ47_10910 [Thermoprotei archaeon]